MHNKTTTYNVQIIISKLNEGKNISSCIMNRIILRALHEVLNIVTSKRNTNFYIYVVYCTQKKTIKYAANNTNIDIIWIHYL